MKHNLLKKERKNNGLPLTKLKNHINKGCMSFLPRQENINIHPLATLHLYTAHTWAQNMSIGQVLARVLRPKTRLGYNAYLS